jgi:hypothetical protein
VPPTVTRKASWPNHGALESIATLRTGSGVTQHRNLLASAWLSLPGCSLEASSNHTCSSICMPGKARTGCWFSTCAVSISRSHVHVFLSFLVDVLQQCSPLLLLCVRCGRSVDAIHAVLGCVRGYKDRWQFVLSHFQLPVAASSSFLSSVHAASFPALLSVGRPSSVCRHLSGCARSIDLLVPSAALFPLHPGGLRLLRTTRVSRREQARMDSTVVSL